VNGYRLRIGRLALYLALFVVVFVTLVAFVGILGFRSWGDGLQKIASVSVFVVSGGLTTGVAMCARRLGLDFGFLAKEEDGNFKSS
jgi:hypothetical protein